MADILYPLLIIVIILGAMFGVSTVSSYFWLRYLDGTFRKCPKCETRSAGLIIDSEDLGSKSEIDFSRTPPLKITTHQVEDTYECEKCKHIWKRTLTETKKKKHKVQISR